MYIDTYQYQEIKEMGIFNSHLVSYGFEKFFYYSYGGIKILNKLRYRFNNSMICEVVDLHHSDNVKYYNRNGKVLQNFYVKMNFYYYDSNNQKLIELKHLKNKRIVITINQFNHDSFHPYHSLDYNMIKRTIKLQKIITESNGKN